MNGKRFLAAWLCVVAFGGLSTWGVLGWLSNRADSPRGLETLEPWQQADREFRTVHKLPDGQPDGRESFMVIWTMLLGEARSAERDRKLCDLLEGVAARDAERALSFALQESDFGLRSELLQACLRGWASTDVESAGTWARSQRYLDWGLAMAAVFQGAAVHPEEAIRYAKHLSHHDPAHARNYGSYIVFALGRIRNHEEAARFAATTPSAFTVDRLNAAYANWGRSEPERALTSAMEQADDLVRRTALYAVISAWSQCEPRALASFALQLPAGPEKDYAVITALRSWLALDPAATDEWISAHGAVLAKISRLELILDQ